MVDVFLLADFDIGDIFDNFIPRLQEISVQLIATLIAFLILWRFLWKPAVAFIKKRQLYIEQQLSQAREEKGMAASQLKEAQEILANAKKQYDETYNKAVIEGQKRKQEILEEANEQVLINAQKAKADLETEKKKVKNQLKEEVIDIALLATKKIINQQIDHEMLNKEILKELGDE